MQRPYAGQARPAFGRRLQRRVRPCNLWQLPGSHDVGDRLSDAPECLGLQIANLRCDQGLICSEEFRGASVADDVQGAGSKGGVGDLDRSGVAVRLARDLTQGCSRHDQHWQERQRGRTFVCDRSENGNRTSTTAPAAGATTPRAPPVCSSPPPSACSLRSAVSETPANGCSSRIMTRARRASASRTGSSRRTLPCSSMTASTV